MEEDGKVAVDLMPDKLEPGSVERVPGDMLILTKCDQSEAKYTLRRFSLRKSTDFVSFGVFLISAFVLTVLVFSDQMTSSPCLERRSELEKISEGHKQEEAQILKEPTRVTVLLDVDLNDFGFSLFLTNEVVQFGTGRARYSYRRVSSEVWKPLPGLVESPCLFVTSHAKSALTWKQRFAPQCATFLTKDEFCNVTSTNDSTYPVEVRQYEYRDSKIPGRNVYLPLGPRIDFYRAVQELKIEAAQRHIELEIQPSSQRHFLFNAIFSRDTSPSREDLAEVLKSEEMGALRVRSRIQIAEKWSRDLSTGQMGPRAYAATLLNSAFTLAPTGHNPESYRIFESIEAGSIPVIALDDSYKSHPCIDALASIRETLGKDGMIFLDSWNDLPRELSRLLQNKTELDARQRRLNEWYKIFMKAQVERLEAVLLNQTQ